jgi:amino acid transporter
MSEVAGTIQGPGNNSSTGKIGRANLGTAEASGLSLAGLAPTMAMALGTAFAASEAGGAVPLCYLLAMVGSFSLAYVIVKFVRRYDVASGVAFTYVRHAFGDAAGFIGGWLYVSAWLSATAVVLAICSVSVTALLARHGITVQWWIVFVVALAIVLVLNYLGVRPSVRAQLALELISMLVLAGVMLKVIIVGGASGDSLQPFNPAISPKGWGGIGFGMIYGFSGFAGFEGAAALGRESRDPARAIPRAIIFCLIGAAVFFILVTYALSVGYGVTHGAAWASDSTPLDTIVGRYNGSAWAQIIDSMVAVSAFSSGLGLVTLSTRIMFDIGRHGEAPSWFTRLHPRHSTPYLGVIIAGAIALVLGITLGVTTGVSTMIGFLAGANTLGLILVYFGMSLGALWRFRPTKLSFSGQVIVVVGVPAVSAVLLGFAFYTSIIPQPPLPFSLEPAIVGLVVVLSAVGIFLLRRRGHTATFEAIDL